MADLLVRLYDLPAHSDVFERLHNGRIVIRRPLASEKVAALAWVRAAFGESWASECDVAFARQPIACFIAVQLGETPVNPRDPYDQPDEHMLGFACYDTTGRGFFGPTGVDPAGRGKGIGTALLVASLQAMADQGHVYAFIGWAGPVDFYRRAVGATPIEGSEPGIYRGKLKTS